MNGLCAASEPGIDMLRKDSGLIAPATGSGLDQAIEPHGQRLARARTRAETQPEPHIGIPLIRLGLHDRQWRGGVLRGIAQGRPSNHADLRGVAQDERAHGPRAWFGQVTRTRRSID